MAKHIISKEKAKLINEALIEYMEYANETYDQAVDYIWSGDGETLRSDLGITLVDLEAWEKRAE